MLGWGDRKAPVAQIPLMIRSIGARMRERERERERKRALVASLLLVAMPGAPSSFLFLVVRPGAPSSVLAEYSKLVYFQNLHHWGHLLLLVKTS